MIVKCNHPFGSAPRVFALEADVEIIPSGTDEESIREAKAQVARLNWARARAARFSDRASAANAARVKRRPLTAELERRWNERKRRGTQ